MSISILLITHDDIGISLIGSLEQMFGQLPLTIKALPIRHESEPLSFCYHAENFCSRLNEGDGVLVLTDLFGATPCNIACSLIHNRYPVRVIAGVNLPMLIKIMNNPKESLDNLAKLAIKGGCQGILDVNQLM
ncbi:PTS sugar transporter subunit IIA [Thioflexithrix psekupsensis]|jgi:mannose PTS system EIIA component|uniref:PTS EIIA type-4 domain-containing protein n=1 Tax=Thioflexithrix psekupsensis TaxID=1570016 RepID=A0A251X8I4_9GAMM|nr:PTS sugar transporter subunit IIA [Thioflexithrix psekupsensis]OUD14306.1 hypothetical protein TPSD3_08260 [Thioflexithrix psekupsensis]